MEACYSRATRAATRNAVRAAKSSITSSAPAGIWYALTCTTAGSIVCPTPVMCRALPPKICVVSRAQNSYTFDDCALRRHSTSPSFKFASSSPITPCTLR
eukprot:TRINITY_DN5555_c0_g1_i1.p2 TRINITY_DN5555_c0_g1~~TRINITY_DN5555_c0_g1_i1.p2  ORF type:complete len:100 (+),score=11.54 TRINITY_DN5555_c0_g1_i1:114-413(+)